jgi:hypothetical protein
MDKRLRFMTDLIEPLAAQETYGALLVLQGLDASGKDSTIKHVMSGINPQGVEVRAFKQPSAEELDHDFLWRYQRSLPGRGQIGIFNRSHYEEVLVVRVHPELLAAERMPNAGEKIWERRCREINDWERYLADNGIHVVKVMLNVSRREQAKRFIKRIDHPDKNWKFSSSDVRERPLGRVPAGLRHHAEPDEHEVGAVVRSAGRSQMVQPPGNRGDPGASAACDPPQVPRRRSRRAGADDAGEGRARGGAGYRAGRR